jgi:plastocyanin
MTRISVVAATLAATLALAACGSSGNGGSPTSTGSQPAGGSSAGTSQPMITIHNFGYTGGLHVKAGATVTVVNKDSTPHTLTDKKTHEFDTGTIDGGATGTFTAPTKPGQYPFGCTFHPEMAGTLTVTP